MTISAMPASRRQEAFLQLVQFRVCSLAVYRNRVVYRCVDSVLRQEFLQFVSSVALNDIEVIDVVSSRRVLRCPDLLDRGQFFVVLRSMLRSQGVPRVEMRKFHRQYRSLYRVEPMVASFCVVVVFLALAVVAHRAYLLLRPRLNSSSRPPPSP